MKLVKVFYLFAFTLLTAALQPLHAQDNHNLQQRDLYYLGINPIAPFTSIRSDFTTLSLPYLSSQETGIAVFVGKVWNDNYNVETRLSFGSPAEDLNLFQVSSGFNYLLVHNQHNHTYGGLWLKLYSLHYLLTKADEVSGIGSLSIGHRLIYNRIFVDFRLNENVYAIKWSNHSGSKAESGFHPSIYKWGSPYIPYVTIGVAYLFR